MQNAFFILYNRNMTQNTNSKAIGERVRNARDGKRMTQTELGSKLKTPVTATAISLYEKGERDIGVKALAEIADILDVSFEFLAKGKTDQEPSIKIALRADKDLQDNEKARDQIMDFIGYVKQKSGKEGSDK